MKIWTGLAAVLLIAIVAVTTVSAFGNGGTIRDALDAEDYAAWKAAVDERHEEMTTEDNFDRMLERRGMMGGMDEELRASLDAALEARDYDAWVALHDQMGKAPRFALTEDDFLVMADMHEARANGDFETADALAEELGFEGGHGMGHGGRGMHGGGMGDCPFAE